MGELGRGKTLHVSSPSHISGNTFWYILGKDHCNTKYFWRVDRNGKRDIIKTSINHQSCYFQRTNQHKGTKKCTRSQIFAERQIQYFFNYHVFYFILSYIILFYHFFAYLFIYFTSNWPWKKNLPSPSPTGVSPFAASFASCDLPGDSRVISIFHCIDYGGSENSPRSHCLYLQRRWTTRKGSGHSLQKPKIRTLTSERTGTV